ncbi:MAG: sulfite exporter TauE/SafE family protein [Deltaproteobacteria bacterium]|nr:MAG: sulfite exporter TauE/SafE family protein [Deltaproteobacteria bacterium]
MDPFDLGVLALVAVLTAILSGILGMAGGITLLAVMLLYLEPLVAIPIHGAVQLISNASRAVIQRRHVAWPFTARFAVLLLPAGYLGYGFARGLPPDALKAAIGAFVLLATWFPGALLLGTHPERADATRRFVTLGGVVGFLSVTIGATGPLIAPFFLNIGLDRRGVVGTKAMCQVLSHVAKLIVFGSVGFAFADHLFTIGLLGVFVIAGTWIGSQLLHRLDERGFLLLYRGVLSLIALRLVVWDGLLRL